MSRCSSSGWRPAAAGPYRALSSREPRRSRRTSYRVALCRRVNISSCCGAYLASADRLPSSNTAANVTSGPKVRPSTSSSSRSQRPAKFRSSAPVTMAWRIRRTHAWSRSAKRTPGIGSTVTSRPPRQRGLAPSSDRQFVEPADPFGVEAHRLQARDAPTVAGLPSEPETGTCPQHGLNPQRSALGQRYLSLDQTVGVLGAVAQSFGDLDLFPDRFPRSSRRWYRQAARPSPVPTEHSAQSW